MLAEVTRLCVKCERHKPTPAFVGSRSVCRSCWVGLSKYEKDQNLTYIGYSQIRRERGAKKAVVQCESQESLST